MSSFDERKKGFEKNLLMMRKNNLKLMQEKTNIQESGPQKFWDMMRKKKINIFKT